MCPKVRKRDRESEKVKGREFSALYLDGPDFPSKKERGAANFPSWLLIPPSLSLASSLFSEEEEEEEGSEDLLPRRRKIDQGEEEEGARAKRGRRKVGNCEEGEEARRRKIKIARRERGERGWGRGDQEEKERGEVDRLDSET